MSKKIGSKNYGYKRRGYYKMQKTQKGNSKSLNKVTGTAPWKSWV